MIIASFVVSSMIGAEKTISPSTAELSDLDFHPSLHDGAHILGPAPVVPFIEARHYAYDSTHFVRPTSVQIAPRTHSPRYWSSTHHHRDPNQVNKSQVRMISGWCSHHSMLQPPKTVTLPPLQTVLARLEAKFVFAGCKIAEVYHHDSFWLGLICDFKL